MLNLRTLAVLCAAVLRLSDLFAGQRPSLEHPPETEGRLLIWLLRRRRLPRLNTVVQVILQVKPQFKTD